MSSTGSSLVDRRLSRAANKWRRLLFLQRTGSIGSVVSLAFLLLGLAMLCGWLTEPVLAKAIVVFVIVVGAIAWMGAGILTVEKDPAHSEMARVLERGQPQLLDRVNTLVALEQKRRQPDLAAFYQRIAHQAKIILAKRSLAYPIPSQRPKLHLLIFLSVLAVTVFLYRSTSPWGKMIEAHRARQLAAQYKPQLPPPDTGLELAAPTNAVREKLPWGEVRITDPARDLRVTKVDVVPLEIEAAANEPLQKVGWSSALNGQSEQPHELPAPAEPRYAAYQPVLYLDELKLSDWDVLSYYAKAATQASNSFASEVYFMEVRPFREDILKMPGGENGKAMQCINELSALISQQQHVIRQTHQHAQNPPEAEKVREQDRRKLAEAETDLGQGANHLYARMANELENTSIGESLDHLAKAERKLQGASKTLRENALPEAQSQERGALADLVAARKAFQQAVSEHPDDFADKPERDTPPTLDSKSKLKEMAEFRDEAKAAEDFMRRLVERQKAVASMARQTNATTRRITYPNLAGTERQIQSDLTQFKQEHPQAFKPVQPQTEATQQTLEQACQSLGKMAPEGGAQTKKAAEQMQQLADDLKDKSAERQLADAYKLKKILDQQIQKLGQCQNPGAGEGPSSFEVRQTVADTRQTLKQLKNTARQSPTSEAFGPELGEALSDANMMALNWPLGELEQAATPEARKKPAGEAKAGLQKVSKAFERSEPKALQMQAKSGQPGEQGEFERGLAQLQSLVKQLEGKRPLSRQNQAKLGAEALYNLQQGMPEKGGSNERGNQILLRLEQELKKGERPVDVEVLKSVMDALQSFSVELMVKNDPKQEKPTLTGVDPSRLPPAYRGRIEKYFQRLSEKP